MQGRSLQEGRAGTMTAAQVLTPEQALEYYGDMVVRTAFGLVKNMADAEDMAQDVFLTLVQRQPAFESPEHQKAWLLRATINRCKSHFRSAWQRRTEGLDETLPAFTPEESGVLEAVAALPMKYRQVVYLHYIEGYSTAEIARLLDRSQNTVLSQLLTRGEADLPVFAQTRAWLDVYFSGREPDVTPPLLTGNASPFRRRVWEILRGIPYGQTVTYGEIARQLAHETGRGVSAQAVGGAVGHNPISLIIPCHRVVGANGRLTGYAGGLDKKIALLRLEGVDTSAFPESGTGPAL